MLALDGNIYSCKRIHLQSSLKQFALRFQHGYYDGYLLDHS